MSADVHELSSGRVVRTGGDGPEGPGLEERVARLERIMERLEPRITEILLTGAKQNELQKLQLDVAELKGKVGALPSTLTILTIVFTTWALGSGILIFALNVLRR